VLNLRSNANCRDFTVTSHSHAIFKNPAPHRGRSNGHEFEAHWTTVDKDLLKMEKYTLIHGLSMNFFFGFNDAQFVRKLVQAVRVFQTSSPGLGHRAILRSPKCLHDLNLKSFVCNVVLFHESECGAMAGS